MTLASYSPGGINNVFRPVLKGGFIVWGVCGKVFLSVPRAGACKRALAVQGGGC